MNNVIKSEENDPSYQHYNSALETIKDEEKKQNRDKLLKIIDEEYSQEISRRQQQIEDIEVQICKTRKLMHVLRYVLVMSYYNKKELQLNGTEETSSLLEHSLINTQGRIHPAIKRLLDNDSCSSNETKNKRKLSTKPSPNTSINTVLNDSSDISQQIKKIKVTEEVNNIQEQKPDISNLPKFLCEPIDDSLRNRTKIKHRIIIGNVCQWIATLENKTLPHKWMLYVRGPKESPDVSHFISKVIFHLHPSYRPNDIITVNKPPFHLTRRGWGEFSVNVEIHFKLALNKPVNVVHFIKLDDKHTGKQILGNETLVDIFLYDNYKGYDLDAIFSLVENNTISDLESSTVDMVKTEQDSLLNTTTANFEHNYCSGDVKMETINEESKTIDKKSNNTENVIFLDHSYSLSSSDTDSPTSMSDCIVPGPLDNKLVFGLGESYLDTNTTKHCKVSFPSSKTQSNNLPKLNSQELNQSSKREIGKLFLNNMETNLKDNKNLVRTNCDNFDLSVPKDRFKSVAEALPYLFKKLPLFTSLANNKTYKKSYPFVVSTSLEEFLKWNIGKRRNAEWARARAIKKILLKENVYGSKKWNTKSIFMYGRSHKYSPNDKIGLFRGESCEKHLLLTCFSSDNSNPNWTPTKIGPEDFNVNVDSDPDVIEIVNNKPKIDISDPYLRSLYSFVKQAALDSRIVLKPEELEDGEQFNGAERIMLEAVKSLAENLIRRASNHAICTQKNKNQEILIRKKDVEYAINERSEMKAIEENQKKKREIDFYYKLGQITQM